MAMDKRLSKLIPIEYITQTAPFKSGQTLCPGEKGNGRSYDRRSLYRVNNETQVAELTATSGCHLLKVIRSTETVANRAEGRER